MNTSIDQQPILIASEARVVKPPEPFHGLRIIDRLISQGELKTDAAAVVEARGIESLLFYLGKDARNALAKLAHVAKFRQHPNDQRIPGKMNVLPAVEGRDCYGIRRKARTADFNTIVKHPHFDRGALDAVIPVVDGIDEGFLPGKGRVLQFLVESRIIPDCRE